jgi:hypothetical protein
MADLNTQLMCIVNERASPRNQTTFRPEARSEEMPNPESPNEHRLPSRAHEKLAGQDEGNSGEAKVSHPPHLSVCSFGGFSSSFYKRISFFFSSLFSAR